MSAACDNPAALYRVRGAISGAKWIRKGSPLSVLIAEIYLRKLDKHFLGRGDIYYQRYVDDITLEDDVVNLFAQSFEKKAKPVANKAYDRDGLERGGECGG